ncbi:AmmeMemoRadiSam system protein A [Halarcobacter ebronensis]|uniref:AMMECR1 domain-containing protein n=1 Tax=Halarcobacter ebronensis TaxID=1462615 RepID=A0A4Q1AQL1_9BACT|nr:AmmeMemoRadiSam system protein A [Halarcobacter ebronensis]QKF81236.1 AmmeMemoRadiSam system protein A [Halarcobacter ebronensis]RXK01798.1 AMMECR1 domain-containing protein [Halarcobacter ebronensis]
MSEKNRVLLKIAKEAIETTFENKKVNKESYLENYDFLKEQEATFVTLTLNGKLRGCIGSLIAHRTLFDDLINNAKAAAFSDPRFNPLTKNEFEKIRIEISILTKPEPLEYKDFEDLKSKLIPKKHGVILQLDGHRATFLPQVWDELSTFEEFMVHLCQKAGLNPQKLSTYPKIETYEAIKIKE